jgi:hypothetical protein
MIENQSSGKIKTGSVAFLITPVNAPLPYCSRSKNGFAPGFYKFWVRNNPV